jgi:hypothetical protein
MWVVGVEGKSSCNPFRFNTGVLDMMGIVYFYAAV